MTDKPTPIAVMDAQDPAQRSSALQHRIAWLRSEGIDPDRARHVEVFSGEDGPYVVVESFVREGDQIPEGAHVEGGVPDEPVKATVRRPVSSLPPREAAVYDLAARVKGEGEMTLREAVATAGMTLLAIACLAVTAVLMLFAALNLPWWCAWFPLTAWTVGLIVVARLMLQEWRDVWRS